MDTLKQAICNALATFIRSRPGFEYANYGDAASYRADVRRAARQKRDAETLLAAVRWRDSITGADLIAAARDAFSGRLTIEVDPSGSVSLYYCVGQYRPTEYRRAAAAVLASALWNWQRESMPHGPNCEKLSNGDRRYWSDYARAGKGDFVSAGDWLRRKFRAEFGSSLARRYFN